MKIFAWLRQFVAWHLADNLQTPVHTKFGLKIFKLLTMMPTPNVGIEAVEDQFFSFFTHEGR